MLKKIINMIFKKETKNRAIDHENQIKPQSIDSMDLVQDKIGLAGGAFNVIVVGVSYYQKALERQLYTLETQNNLYRKFFIYDIKNKKLCTVKLFVKNKRNTNG